jgi:hypothetical protein
MSRFKSGEKATRLYIGYDCSGDGHDYAMITNVILGFVELTWGPSMNHRSWHMASHITIEFGSS